MPPSHSSISPAIRRFRATTLTALALAASLSVIAGCESDGTEKDEDEVLMPPEVGTNVREWQDRQVTKADAAYFIFYRHEWQNVDDTATLSEFGFNHARRVAERAVAFDYPVIIEPEPGQPELDQRRVDYMIEFLTDRNVPQARRRVVVAVPREIPRDADEFPNPGTRAGAGMGSGKK
jgi:hypothetical protein